MYRKILLIMILTSVLFMAGCTKTVQTENDNEVTQTTDNSQTTDDSAGTDIESEKPAVSDVDLDLTKRSNEAVFDTVYSMLLAPEEYVGNTVRIRGEYYSSYDEDLNQVYHFVVVSDEDEDEDAQCGLEFMLDEGLMDYPLEGSLIELTGVLDLYDELGQAYSYLSVDTMEIK